ncbi:hypothetical protein KM043_013265 [Ampulex compressa]|nr:hypothetical protein KM043_013265 [Ampulex compressa]
MCFTGDFAVAQERPTVLNEYLDEQHDAEIFQAVVQSMRQWTLHKKYSHRKKREVSKVCYEDVGCFEDTGPFSYLEMLPSPPKDVGTRFLVYGSRKARSIPMEVPAEDINDNAHRAIDPDLPTKVIVHGFGSSCDHVWVYEMRSALMSVQDCNIVCVDWGPGSAVPNYVRAAANTRLVGRQLAKLIRNLNVSLERVHLIGFSLGAHVAGFAGAELGNVSRITGLDPAGPLFESQDPRARLDATDANFVDVIHSNGEPLILGGLGSWQPMGHVDFYPNGGRMQTGCSNLFLGAVSDIIWSSAVEGKSLCNHRRAYKFFTDSVSPKCRFPAFPCENGYDGLLKGDCFPCDPNGVNNGCGDMGYYSDESSARGQLYLVTRDEEPFCAYQYQVKVYNSRSERPTKSYGKLQVTLVGEKSFNDTFGMTRKDEELLVGAILQKIVVPHPAVSNLEAIEIKYTAYSGWISSGLVSWSIDKVAVVDSFGKILSVCMKGLILESGRPVYLPLFPGECNIPVEADNQTSSTTFERIVQDKRPGIGPFTIEQNYENREGFTVDLTPEDTSTWTKKGLGPFTKEQNPRLSDKEDFDTTNSFQSSEYQRSTSNPWSILDISRDGDSNSLENLNTEKGRGFSGTNFISSSPATTTATDTTTESQPEIREPVLQVTKKETGRSLRLPEITEPILGPRSTRQNSGNEVAYQEKPRDEIQETSSTRFLTVQFLPERLAGLLAQAERYARQTLLPFISQYTPSFMAGARHEEQKYFPPLGDLDSEEVVEISRKTTQHDVRYDNGDSRTGMKEQTAVDTSTDRGSLGGFVRVIESQKERKDLEGRTSTMATVYPIRNSASSANGSSTKSGMIEIDIEAKSDWVPIEESTTARNEASSRSSNVSRSLEWDGEGSTSWNSRMEVVNLNEEDKTDEWVPITLKTEPVDISVLQSTTSQSVVLKKERPTVVPVTESADVGFDGSVGTSKGNVQRDSSVVNEEKRFIPLTDWDDDKLFSSTNSNDILDHNPSTVVPSHIQKIARSNPKNVQTNKSSTRRAMIFPYAYERKKDPRTRYIPLIPEEDMGKSRLPIERKR